MRYTDLTVRTDLPIKLSARDAILLVVYRERAARLSGAVVWQAVPTPDDPADKRVLPDGCMDLMWSAGELLVAGPDTQAHVGPVASYTAIRFAPGTAPGLFGVPAHELRDQRVPLADLWPADRVRRLTSRIASAAKPGAALEHAALDLMGDPDPAMTELVRRLRTGSAISTAAADGGFSERQLHRRSLAAFGYGPKLLGRILRLHRALDLARSGVPYATVAVQAGYADQAHLSRDVKALAGVPLRVLLS
jgi:AraC-like DNA-binding protein